MGSTLSIPYESTLVLSNEITTIYFNPSAEGSCEGDLVWSGGRTPERRNVSTRAGPIAGFKRAFPFARGKSVTHVLRGCV